MRGKTRETEGTGGGRTLATRQKESATACGVWRSREYGKTCGLLCSLGSGSFLGRSLGGLCYGCFGCGSLGGRRLLGATGATGLLLRLEHVLVEVNELDEAGGGSIALAEASLDDAGVATGTLGHLLRDDLEELGDGELVLQVAEDKTAVGRGVLLRAVDQGLDVLAQSLCLGHSGVDSLVHDERNGHVGEHRVAVRCGAAKMVEFLIMSHCLV